MENKTERRSEKRSQKWKIGILEKITIIWNVEEKITNQYTSLLSNNGKIDFYLPSISK